MLSSQKQAESKMTEIYKAIETVYLSSLSGQDINKMDLGYLTELLQQQLRKSSKVLTCKTVLKDNQGFALGVAEHYIDITGYFVQRNQGQWSAPEGKFYLGERFNNEYFTFKEYWVFKLLLLGYSNVKIAAQLFKSVKTVESIIATIKRKLQCQSKSEIVPKAIQCGLTHIIEEDRVLSPRDSHKGEKIAQSPCLSNEDPLT